MNLSGLRASERQDLVDEPLELVELLELAAEPAALLVVEAGCLQRDLDLAAQRRERRPQLVRQRGAELTHLPHRLLEPAPVSR